MVAAYYNNNDNTYRSMSGYNYSYVYPFEKYYLDAQFRQTQVNWMIRNWKNAVFISFIYVIVIFSGQRFMRNRERFELRACLVLWNLSLAVFSIFGAMRTLPEFLYILSNHDFKYTVCTETFTYGITGFWSWLFIISKVFELVDTIFIVLRKRPLIFLHWYHHVTVLDYVWYAISEFPATGRWFATINFTIHAFMYSYYTLVAIRIFSLPSFISILITSSQIVQMVIGVYVNVKALQYKLTDSSCQVTYDNIALSLVMYSTYLYLFIDFFLKKYFTIGYNYLFPPKHHYNINDNTDKIQKDKKRL